jgi:hypothetical protein
MPSATDRILDGFRLAPSDLIGEGSESRVYALDGERVLRILRQPAAPDQLALLQHFLVEIDGRMPFATPRILAIANDGAYTIERRLPGLPMPALIFGAGTAAREEALRNYFTAVAAFRSVVFPDEPYGQLLAAQPITADDWIGYLRESLAHYSAINGATIADEVGDVAGLEAKALLLLSALEPHPERALVHGDYFPGNVLMDGDFRVTAVVDFGFYTVVGDPLLDVAGASIFLEMSGSPPEDIAYVRKLLAERHGPGTAPSFAFYRAYFAFAMADPVANAGLYPGIYLWSLANLRALRDGDPRRYGAD